jgi:hypothetical protein
MAVRAPVYTATPSQWASAAMHLDRQSEWVTFRVSGVRYVALPSGNSGRTYWVRASADGCSCPWYTRTLEQCSHMLAVYAQATEQELAEAPLMADLYRRCARVGCETLCEGTTLCDECSAMAERSERMAAARASVLEGWTA